ncbi:hypothetical protein JCM9957A_01960 [Kineosporia succinea]
MVALVSVPFGALSGSPLAYLASVGCSAVFVSVAVFRVPPARRRPWLGMLWMMYLSVAGETWFVVLHLRGVEQWPSGADVVYISAYLALAWGVLALDGQRHHRPAFGSLLDAAIVTCALAVLAVVFLVGPLLADPGQSVSARLIGSLYPLMDVMLVYLVARMLIGPRRQVAASWWMIAALVDTLAADVAQNVIVLTTGSEDFPGWMDAAWLLFYVLVGCGAVSARGPAAPAAPVSHVSSGAPATTDASGEGGLTVVRLSALGLAAGLPAVVQIALALTGDGRNDIWLGAGSLVLLVMVVSRIWDLLQQLRRQSEQLALVARTDPLTGVANRRSWDFELARAMAAATQAGTVLVVGLLDLDHFKKYNDAHGHQAGDELLQEAARAWSAGVGPGGRIARWGGEEFAVLVHCPETRHGLAVLDGLRALVPFAQTCSIGAARWDGTEDAAELLRRADEALYRAKNAGRDRLGIWTPTGEPVDVP